MIYEIINGKVSNIFDNDYISNIEHFRSEDSTIRLYDYDPRISVLNNLRNIKKHSIEDAFDILMRNGYDTGNGYYLSAEKADREAFAQDALLHNRAVELNIINNSDNVTFADKNGAPRILAVLEYITLLVNYGLWCRQQIMNKSYKMYLLANATTEEQINLI